MVENVLDAGAQGYVLKSDPHTASLVKAVKEVSGGRRSLTPKVSEIVVKGFLKARSDNQLEGRTGTQPTSRQLEIIRLLAEGKINKEIACQLGIAVRTVEASTRQNIMQGNLGFALFVADIVQYALRQGVISLKSR